jgi:hypothetical protein
MLPAAGCPEQQTLRERYLAALRVYRDMIPILDAASTPREFETAYEHAEAARWLFLRTRSDLYNHTQQHACAVVEELVAAS